MQLREAKIEELENVRNFYWELIDAMKERDNTVGWKKGIYLSEGFLLESIKRKELYVLDGINSSYAACVIVNSSWNEGYEGCPWSISCTGNDVLVPHALAVNYVMQGKGIGKNVIRDIIEMAKLKGKKTIRLDVLAGNIAAKRLYTKMGFRYVQAKEMFYEDTGWTEYIMYELILSF